MADHEDKNSHTRERTPDRNDIQTETMEVQHHNWVTDLYDRANLTVRQLNVMAIALLALIFALFVIFGK